MKGIKLKHCPFCGGKDMSITKRSDFYELQGKYGGAAIKIRCRNCDADMWEHSRSEHNYEKRVEQAVEKWNRRAEPVKHGEWLKFGTNGITKDFYCSKCKGLVKIGYYAY